jgi:anti-sigma regulatory factor (Ser/Thr protein kinase)
MMTTYETSPIRTTFAAWCRGYMRIRLSERQVDVIERLPVNDDAPRAARAFALQVLADIGAGAHRSHDLALVVSELVTNAVVHGPDGELELRLVGTPATIRVEVCDGGTKPFLWPDISLHTQRGLNLVRSFSDRAGLTQQPSTRVWCELDLKP